MATLKDVARLACVDVSTVSRALNNTSYVHPDTKARIFAAVKELSYQPNVLAKGLRHGKRRIIGIVVPNLFLTIFSEVATSIEIEASNLGYSTFICCTEDNPAIEKECLNRLRNGFVDGIIIASTGHSNRILRDIQADGIAVTQIIRKHDLSINSVVANYEACGYNTAKYLISKGCREIGLIIGPTDLAPYRERYIGYKRALKEAGLNETIASSDESFNTFEYGYHCTQKLLDKNASLDAIMAVVDIQGMAALRVLKEDGILVPSQVRVVSMTGHSIGAFLETGMTSIEIPAAEIGKTAVRMVVDSIESDIKNLEAVHVVVEAELVERES